MSGQRFRRQNHGKGHSYTLDGYAIPGVTTIIGTLDKPALVNWAAEQSASFAVENWARLSELPLVERLKQIQNARFQSNRAAVVKGNRIHSMAQQLLQTGQAPVEPENPVYPQVMAVAKFLDDWGMEQVVAEAPVCNTEYRYAGTMDSIMTSPRLGTILCDWKGLALDTPIPTPDGWTTMGEVQVGDDVFTSDGSVCRVTAKSQTKRIGTYRVRFDDGAEVICDTEHIWWTQTRRETSPTAKPIAEVISTLIYSGQRNHRVPLAGALDLPDVDLPIDPYLLGCWLGDGKTRSGEICKGRDLFEILESDGHALGVEQMEAGDCITRTVLGLRTKLRESELLGSKHIPSDYLRAGTTQRLRLLQGLMDTDGTWNIARSRAVFSTSDKRLADGVFELLASLGQRPHLNTVTHNGYGLTVTAYDVEWSPLEIEPFRLPRKASKVTAKRVPRTTRMIVAVEPGPDVETACIGVDAPNRTYLCGQEMIPTHNTGKGVYDETALQLAAYKAADLMLVPEVQVGPRGGKKTIWVEKPLPSVDGCYVAHVLADSIELHPAVVDDEVLTAFLYLREVYGLWIERTSWKFRDQDSFQPTIGDPIYVEDRPLAQPSLDTPPF